MSTVTLVARPPLTRGLIRRPAANPRPWAGLAIGVVLAIAAGGFHAAGWLLPGAWWTIWIAQAGTIAIGALFAPKRALALGFAMGLLAIASSFYWGVEALASRLEASLAVAGALFAVMVVIEAIGFGLFCLSVSIAMHCGMRWLWLIPSAWVAIEHWYPRLFPWKMGYSQLELLPLIQIAELVGPTGIGFVMTAVAAIPIVLVLLRYRSVSAIERRWSSTYVVSAILLFAATLLFGHVRISQWSSWDRTQPKIKLGLIQVDPSYVGSVEKLRERSLAIHEQVDLLCWPESSLGVYSQELTHFRDQPHTVRLSRDSRDSLEPAKQLACHLLAGGKLYRPEAAETGPYAMTAFLISPDQEILGRYRKRTLLPFGEYVPGQRWFPALRDWASIEHLVEAGSNPAPLVTADGRKLGLVICYEDTLPRNARATVAAGAEALFSLIHGNAFENRLTLVQHQRLAAFRAVENRRNFVRCSSTGVTCVIDATGKIIAQLPIQSEGTLRSEIALHTSPTVFNRFGDFFPVICTIFCLGGFVLCIRNSRQSSSRSTSKIASLHLLGERNKSLPN